MLLLLFIGAGISTSIPFVDDSVYHGDAYIYDQAGATGSVTGGTIQPGPDQDSATGSISGGTIIESDYRYD